MLTAKVPNSDGEGFAVNPTLRRLLREARPYSGRLVVAMLLGVLAGVAPLTLARVAGLEGQAHPHGLRHTYAVELERAGVPVSQISKLLGHSSIAVTSRYLDHLSNAAAIEALEAVELPAL